MIEAGADSDCAVAFLGYPVTNRRAAEDATLSLADNKMQHGYLAALNAAFLSVTAVSSVPAVHAQGGTDDGALTWIHVGVPRLSFLRPLHKLVSLYRLLDEWAKSSAPRDRVLIYYNTFLLYALVAWALRLRHRIAVVPIAITLPYRPPGLPVSAAARIQDHLSARLLKRVDGLIAISPFLGGAVAPGVPMHVVRGGVREDAVEDALHHVTPAGHAARRIVYAGNLTSRYNLEAAVAMMAHLPPGSFELHLYGRGELEARLRELVEESPSVHLQGVLGAEQIPQVLAEADLLLALLDTTDHLARYSFPSKLFESLASGTPTLTTELPTLTAEMKEHLVVVDSLRPADLASKVLAVCERPEHETQVAAAAAIEYVREHATWTSAGRELEMFLVPLAAGVRR